MADVSSSCLDLEVRIWVFKGFRGLGLGAQPLGSEGFGGYTFGDSWLWA